MIKKTKIKKNNSNQKMMEGLALDIAVGLPIGVALHSIGAGIAIGVALGAAFGASNSSKIVYW